MFPVLSTSTLCNGYPNPEKSSPSSLGTISPGDDFSSIRDEPCEVGTNETPMKETSGTRPGTKKPIGTPFYSSSDRIEEPAKPLLPFETSNRPY